jgi:lysophospholipase L1-like esterase
VTALLLCLLPARALAGERVLPPAAAQLVYGALQQAGARFPLASARVERSRVWASLCRDGDPARCFSLALGDARGACAGTIAGPWCVTYPDGAPPEEARAPLLTALGALREEALWRDPDEAGPRAPPPPIAVPPPPPPRLARTAALALALVVGPLAAGLALGRRLGGSVRRAAILALTPLLATLAALPALARLGAWDALAPAILVGAGVVMGSGRAPARALGARLALVAVSTLVALAGLELAARALPAPAASFAPPREVQLLLPAAEDLGGCAPLHPDAAPAAFAARTAAVRPGAPVVLHLGDSMVEGVGVTPEEAFPALLGRAQPGVAHVNAGFAGTSLDFQLLVARAWLPRLAATRVVLHVFGYNDLAELDRATPCCPGGPLLDAAAEARCAAPAWPHGRLDRLAASPAPYGVRVAAGSSALARRAVLGFAALGARLGAAPPPADRWARYAQLLRALATDLKRRGVPLTVVYLPARASLEGPSPRESGDHALRGRVLELARSLGAEAVDPWELLEDAVRAEGAARWYLPPPDIHFTAAGHRLLAEWLARGALATPR